MEEKSNFHLICNKSKEKTKLKIYCKNSYQSWILQLYKKKKHIRLVLIKTLWFLLYFYIHIMSKTNLFNTNFIFFSNRVLKFLQTLRLVQNNEPIRDKLKQYREAYNYGTETGLDIGSEENLVNSVCSEIRYPCRSTQKSLQRNTRALVDFAGF